MANSSHEIGISKVVASYHLSPDGYPAGGGDEVYGGTATSPFGYAGQYTDSESGLQYLRAWYYDPGTAQFLTVDPLVGVTGQPYSYAGDNALNAIDPLGADVFGVGGWVHHHEQGVIVGTVVVGVGVAAAARIVATDGICAAVTPEDVADAGATAARWSEAAPCETGYTRRGETSGLRSRIMAHRASNESRQVDQLAIPRSQWWRVPVPS
jgi:RHS repeat-associated protein